MIINKKPYMALRNDAVNIIQDNFSILQQEIIDLKNQLNKENKIRRKQQWRSKIK